MDASIYIVVELFLLHHLLKCCEFEIKLEKKIEKVTIDKTTFKKCEIKEKEQGILRKKLLYIHNNGKKLHIVKVDPALEDVKQITLPL
ncbi:MAG: hypothetical protein QXX79_01750 [Candidatus Bathyarchaeia archaeon]